MMSLFQILILLFALFAISRVLLRFKDKSISSREFLFWVIIWAGIAIINLLPGLTSFFTKLLGVGRGVDLLIYVSIILLFYLMFKMYVRIDKIDNNITELIRRESIRKK